mmetsp:Transcript_15725/g.47557  ORF Transcript_15725/g.47557 Transcript_15725/m.47557 type:complete len:248 (+) Transcript_15725:169-912(+)
MSHGGVHGGEEGCAEATVAAAVGGRLLDSMLLQRVVLLIRRRRVIADEAEDEAGGGDGVGLVLPHELGELALAELVCGDAEVPEELVALVGLEAPEPLVDAAPARRRRRSRRSGGGVVIPGRGPQDLDGAGAGPHGRGRRLAFRDRGARPEGRAGGGTPREEAHGRGRQEARDGRAVAAQLRRRRHARRRRRRRRQQARGLDVAHGGAHGARPGERGPFAVVAEHGLGDVARGGVTRVGRQESAHLF